MSVSGGPPTHGNVAGRRPQRLGYRASRTDPSDNTLVERALRDVAKGRRKLPLRRQRSGRAPRGDDLHDHDDVPPQWGRAPRVLHRRADEAPGGVVVPRSSTRAAPRRVAQDRASERADRSGTLTLRVSTARTAGRPAHDRGSPSTCAGQCGWPISYLASTDLRAPGTDLRVLALRRARQSAHGGERTGAPTTDRGGGGGGRRARACDALLARSVRALALRIFDLPGAVDGYAQESAWHWSPWRRVYLAGPPGRF